MNPIYYRVLIFCCVLLSSTVGKISTCAHADNLYEKRLPSISDNLVIEVNKNANLNLIIAGVKDKTATVKISSSIELGSNLIIPENITLVISDEGRINQGSYSVVVKGNFRAGPTSIFTGIGQISFVYGSIEKVYPQWFGAKGNGINDDTNAIQAAVKSAAKGCHIYFPASTYLISSSIVVASSDIIIDGSHSTLLLNDSTGKKHHLQIGTGLKQTNGVYVKDLNFTRAQAAKAGAAIYFNYAGVCYVNNVRVYGDNKIFNGIVINRGIMISVFDSYIQGTIDNGINMYGTDDTDMRTVDIRIDRCRIEQCKNGIFCGNYVEGLYIRNNIIYNCTSAGFVYDATHGKGRYSVKIQQNDFDSCGLGIFLQNCSNISIDGNWFSNNVGINIDLANGVKTAVLNNNQIYGKSSNSIQISGSYIRLNGNLLSGGTQGIYLKAEAQDVHISSNDISNLSGYGVHMFENPKAVSVVDNSFYGNGTGTVGDVASPSSRFISNNFGYPSGSSYITVGPSPFSYSSGSTPESISIYGGNISSVSIDGVNISLSNNISFMLPPQKTVVIRYQELPIMAKTRW